MRALALWAVLFAAYAATLGVNAAGPRDYGGDEPRYLLVAESIVSDGDIDLTDEFASRPPRLPRPCRGRARWSSAAASSRRASASRC